MVYSESCTHHVGVLPVTKTSTMATPQVITCSKQWPFRYNVLPEPDSPNGDSAFRARPANPTAEEGGSVCHCVLHRYR